MTHPDQPEAWRKAYEATFPARLGPRDNIDRAMRAYHEGAFRAGFLAASKGGDKPDYDPSLWVLVPKEPSDAMIRAALDAHAENAPYETPFGPDGSFAHHYRAMLAASAVPERWVLVPRVPTEAMMQALEFTECGEPDGTAKALWEPVYRAMLAASPSPPETAGS
jgi:hypothetical protein